MTMTKFWGCVKTNEYSKRDMLAPTYSKTVKRASRKALTEAYLDFCALLATQVPHVGATALFEQTDRNGYNVVRVAFTGEPDAYDLGTDGYCGVPVGGVWFVESGPEGLTDMVRAGRTNSTPRYLARQAERNKVTP